MSWDDVGNPKLFNFEADLLINHAPGTNRICAYKFGPAGEWFNEFFPNLQQLEWDTKKYAGAKIKPDLYVAVPKDQSQLIRTMNLLGRPSNLDRKLRIHVFDQGQNVQSKVFVFQQVALKQSGTPYTISVKIPLTNKSVNLPLPVLVFKLGYQSLDIV